MLLKTIHTMLILLLITTIGGVVMHITNTSFNILKPGENITGMIGAEMTDLKSYVLPGKVLTFILCRTGGFVKSRD